MIEFLISTSKMPKGQVGYMGQVTKIANVIMKVSHTFKTLQVEWDIFTHIYLQEKNRVDTCSLGHGNFVIDSDLSLPEIEEEFYDALQDPEELYQTTYNEQDLVPVKSSDHTLQYKQENLNEIMDEAYNSAVYWKINIDYPLEDLNH